jgi:two-component system cell cycle response regulator
VTPDGSSATRRPKWWLRLLVGGAGAIVVYYLLPLAGPPAIVSDLVSLLFPVAATTGVLVGLAMHRPAHRAPWIVLAAGEGVNLLGDLVGAFQRNVLHNDPYPSAADVLYLLAYPLLALALVLVVRRRTPESNMPALIDASVLSIALGLLWWLYVISPLTTANGTILERASSVAYPLMDVLLLAIALRLTVGVGARTRSFSLLLASILTTLLADMVYALLTAKHLYSTDDTWMDWTWLAAYLLLGAAGLHPSMRLLDRRAAVVERGMSRGRLAVLTAAGLLPLVVLLGRYFAGGDLGVPAIVAAAVALFVLMLIRLWQLAGSHGRLAIHDGLTGVYSRRFFDEAFRTECARSRDGRGDLALVLVDVDNFVLVNEMYGSVSGDLALAEVATRLHHGARPGDVVAREGSDRFIVLMPGIEPRDAALLADRLRTVVSDDRIMIGDGGAVRVTVSVGLAMMPRDGETPLALMHAADQALYVAKRAGRNRTYTVHGPVNVEAFGSFILP